jgi:hypothetical protein
MCFVSFFLDETNLVVFYTFSGGAHVNNFIASYRPLTNVIMD